jgi:hypothetical protein
LSRSVVIGVALLLLLGLFGACGKNKGLSVAVPQSNSTDKITDVTVIPTPTPTPTVTEGAPWVVSISTPFPEVVSSIGVNTSTVVEVVCSESGYAKLVYGNSEVSQLYNVVGRTESQLTILASTLEALSSSDGVLEIKAVCRNARGLEGTSTVGVNVRLDRTPPPSLGSFVGSSGAQAGYVHLKLVFPSITSDIVDLRIRRLAGLVAPSANCKTNGQEVYRMPRPFVDADIEDYTGSVIGGKFSYRVCIYDSAGNLRSTDSALGVAALDVASPPALSSFSGATGTALAGDVVLTWEFPPTTSDYFRMDIRELKGTVAPDATCTNGTPIRSYTSFPAETMYVRNTGNVAGEDFSYRVCIYDQANHLTSSNFKTSVKPRAAAAQPGLQAFTAVPGTVHGKINITITYPVPVPAYSRVDIRGLKSATAPADCDGATIDAAGPDSVVMSFTSATGFTSGVYSTGVLSNIGERFSFRACLYEPSGNVNSAAIQENVSAKDLVAPADLVGFSAGTGTSTGVINLSVQYPSDVSDYSYIQLIRKVGTTPPTNCSDGSVAVTLITFLANGSSSTSETLPTGSFYSYRACVYDRSGNLSFSRTAAGVQPGSSCSLGAAQSQSYSGLKAYIPDLDTQLDPPSTTTLTGAGSPKRILSDKVLKVGDLIQLTASSGQSIGRISGGVASATLTTDCPDNWFIYFKRANGTLYTPTASVPANLSTVEAGSGIVVPEANLTAYIGFRDTSYADNCGARFTTGAGCVAPVTSPDGCNFTFKYYPYVCN